MKPSLFGKRMGNTHLVRMLGSVIITGYTSLILAKANTVCQMSSAT